MRKELDVATAAVELLFVLDGELQSEEVVRSGGQVSLGLSS
jgi:hypothetical protein